MSLDYSGEVIVNYSTDDVFNALKDGLPKLSGFSVTKVDKILRRFDLKAGVSLFSWGENLTVAISQSEDGRTKVSVSSIPKTGAALGGFMDMGKNQKNINAIFSCLSVQLKKYKELSPMHTQQVSSEGNDPVATLQKLQQMLERNLISQGEFDAKKQEILARL